MRAPAAIARIRHRLFLWANYRPHTWNCTHRTLYWTAAPRCTSCGHRQADAAGRAPRQTRELPAVLWPFEIAGRIEARIRGRLSQKGRLPL